MHVGDSIRGRAGLIRFLGVLPVLRAGRGRGENKGTFLVGVSDDKTRAGEGRRRRGNGALRDGRAGKKGRKQERSPGRR